MNIKIKKKSIIEWYELILYKNELFIYELKGRIMKDRTIIKIKKLFDSLPLKDQLDLLDEWGVNKLESIHVNDDSININVFSQKHQKQFKKNIEFEIVQSGLDHMPTITAILKTEFGTFEGIGDNQKMAKANAIEKANEIFNI